MANEVAYSYITARTSYVLIRNTVGQIWNTSGGTGAFESYQSSVYASYSIAAVEQGTTSAFYTASVPTAVPAGSLNIVAKSQVGGSPAETDGTVDTGSLEWNGSTVVPLSSLATSGQLSNILPVRVARANMIRNFPVYLKSAADHITPFTSGVVSGQIARDAGNFGPLQSGLFVEIGNGFFNLQALTSGDVNAGTVKLLFTATGVSGGSSDPLPMSFICQPAGSGF